MKEGTRMTFVDILELGVLRTPTTPLATGLYMI